MKNARAAEQALYGDANYRLIVRARPGGTDRIDDVAQAWIDGNHEPGLAYARAHEEKIRLRGYSVNVSRRDKVVELRKQGWTAQAIAAHLEMSQSEVMRLCRGLPRQYPPGRVATADVQKMTEMFHRGAKHRDIAAALGLSPRHVSRILANLSLRRYRKLPCATASSASATT